MWFLMGVWMFGAVVESTSLANLQGKWVVGLRMTEFEGILEKECMRKYRWPGFDRYSILWKPFKTVMIGIAESGCNSPPVRKGRRRRRRREDSGSNYNYESQSWEMGIKIGIYKYFRVNNSVSPFIALSPCFNTNYYYDNCCGPREGSNQTYSVSIDPGIEYFFGIMGKQMSVRFKTCLVNFSRTYAKSKWPDGREYSYMGDKIFFYSPTGGSLSTWLCFHF